MVTVTFNKFRLLSKCEVQEDELESLLFDLKSEVKPKEGGQLEVEVNADRLDLLSSDGIARAVKGLKGKALGEASYKQFSSSYILEVNEVRSRPFVAAAVLEDVVLGEEGLRELIQFQEKLHTTIGRKRRKVAVGIHDLSKVDTKVIKYSTLPLDYKFVPLGAGKLMSLREVLSETEQGRNYGQISLSEGRLPAILQEDGQVLSVPPVINSEKTKLTAETDRLLIDVTGTSGEAVVQTLDILVTNLAEGGAKIGTIELQGGVWQSTPVLNHDALKVELEYIRSASGYEMACEQVVALLSKARLDSSCDGQTVSVTIPPYRIDILGRADIVEEVLMAYGYSRVDPIDFIVTKGGSLLTQTKLIRALRDLAVGAGFTEVFNFVLVDGRDFKGNSVKLANPVTADVNSVRSSLIPGLLKMLSKNQKVGFPVKVFEIGEVVLADAEKETGYTNRTMMSLATIDSKISYEQLQSALHAILTSLGVTPSYTRYDNSYFMEGRGAKIIIDDEEVGVVGEVHPRELEFFGLTFPAMVAEVSVDELLKLLRTP
ncbi:phenylalanine--tRNA ligase subunit beta [Sulfodiicoccus acidiphilus]|uniref:phenylalanine--tRNA ligase n=1 Tax=Sulfodiicoccus acidiphilus TaxID=1670455 RepID=A0A348B0I4_9CREN|nr:phenylalanine--tRNA ligase subunit beta [Sulfodiicoccus acidiphilus]BBD71686.1 phenylalanine--tRNA ligase subunit beta [Sulfodiicoccus acidiphilus]GGT86607.1 phenylalanine--tRNA ligase subunit beta [Sulfodiicoccus acidiphilus]